MIGATVPEAARVVSFLSKVGSDQTKVVIVY